MLFAVNQPTLASHDLCGMTSQSSSVDRLACGGLVLPSLQYLSGTDNRAQSCERGKSDALQKKKQVVLGLRVNRRVGTKFPSL